MSYSGVTTICSMHYVHITISYTLINKSLNGYGDSTSNGFRWEVHVEWIVHQSRYAGKSILNG